MNSDRHIVYQLLFLVVATLGFMWLSRYHPLGVRIPGGEIVPPGGSFGGETDVYLPSEQQNQGLGTVAIVVPTPFLYNFNANGSLPEAGSMDESNSGYWWVNSGGILTIGEGEGRTNFGELPAASKWYSLYARANPIDTDNGNHPQNIFRLLTRSRWNNVRQQVYFKIAKDNLSSSPNRNASNGLLLFSRYLDSANLYYVGVRVDGAAVIKKKINGTYYTIASVPYLAGSYNRDTSPNLLPKSVWIGLRSETVTNLDSSVTIRLYVDEGRTGVWKLVLQGKDDGLQFGGGAITREGYTGIRTDFMDVSFYRYIEEKL